MIHSANQKYQWKWRQQTSWSHRDICTYIGRFIIKVISIVNVDNITKSFLTLPQVNFIHCPLLHWTKHWIDKNLSMYCISSHFLHFHCSNQTFNGINWISFYRLLIFVCKRNLLRNACFVRHITFDHAHFINDGRNCFDKSIMPMLPINDVHKRTDKSTAPGMPLQSYW